MSDSLSNIYDTESRAPQTCSLLLGVLLAGAPLVSPSAHAHSAPRRDDLACSFDLGLCYQSASADSVSGSEIVLVAATPPEDIIAGFARRLAENMVDAPPESGKIIADHFWELLGGLDERGA